MGRNKKLFTIIIAVFAILAVWFLIRFVVGGSEDTVKIFLSDSRFAGEPYFDCSRTTAVERQVPKTLAVAKAALEALLRGATQEEIDKGFVSNEAISDSGQRYYLN